jgi:hypothetical protein
MTQIDLNQIHRKFWKRQARIERKIWKRGFVCRPALEDFRARLAASPTDNESARMKYFRAIPSFNAILLKHDLKLALQLRNSAQQERARQPRQQIRRAHANINKLIEELAKSPGPAKQLWKPFVEGLDALGYQPERKSTRSDSETCRYILNGKTRTISERQLANRISAIRSKRRKSLG